MIEFTDDHRDIREMVSGFSENELAPNAEALDESAQFPAEGIRALGELGLLAAAIPEEHGGSGSDLLTVVLILEELARGCGSTATAVAAHAFGGAVALRDFGSQQALLGALASGQRFATVAMPDRLGGELTTAKSTGSGWEVEGEKVVVVGGGHADVIVFSAEVDGTPNLFVLDGRDAVELSEEAGSTLGLRGAGMVSMRIAGTLPESAHLGGADAVSATATTLALASSAISVGIGFSAHEYSARYANERHAFGGPISRFESLRAYVANAATQLTAASLLVYRGACERQKGDGRVTASMAKVAADEAVYRACKNAVQILGGNGYSREYPVERMYRDAKTLEVFGRNADWHRQQLAENVLG